MAPKEPGYWVKWVTGIVGTVVGGLLVAAPSGAFDRDPPEPQSTLTPTATGTPTPTARVRISECAAQTISTGQVPVARFRVYNAGDDGADRCTIRWNTFGPSPDSGTGVVYSEEFAVEPDESYALTLRGVVPHLLARTFMSGAQVRCLNASSTVAVDFVSVRAATPGS